MHIFRNRHTVPREPEEQRRARRGQVRVRAALCVVSGILLGASFPPSTLGILACFGLVPLLIVLADVDEIGTGLRYSYLAFLIFHVITLNWTGGYAHGRDPYMMIAGAATMVVHPLFYFIPMVIYLLTKKHLGERAALVVLPFCWVGYEYTHMLSEWSFPWLTIANSQSYEHARMQFISVTGVLGLSFWIVLLNTLAYLFYSALAHRGEHRMPRGALFSLAGFLLLYYLPAVYGWRVLSGAPETADGLRQEEKTITVGMIQANIDPWEKWTQNGYISLERYLDMTATLTDTARKRKPDLVLWPETAVPYDLHGDLNRPLFLQVRNRISESRVSVLTGMPYFLFYTDSSSAPRSAKRRKFTGERYDAFNAATLIQPDEEQLPWYGKMKMVPLAERVPYADLFAFVGFLQWGVGIGGWQIGPQQTIFQEKHTGTRFCTLICYESVYPGFVASFIRSGAEFISIITIDSWWDRMSGAFQHERFAIFRAVENRRWLARCAVGGISCYIDPYGGLYDETELFTTRILNRTIGRSTELTYYSEHGDWLGQICVWISGLFLAAVGGQLIKQRIRAQQWQTP
jgi:apolipoprotein N-acyltransferase